MRTEDIYVNGILIKNIIYDDSDMSTQEQKDNWLSICQTCQQNKNGQCEECGCLIITKIVYSDSLCPINKW